MPLFQYRQPLRPHDERRRACTGTNDDTALAREPRRNVPDEHLQFHHHGIRRVRFSEGAQYPAGGPFHGGHCRAAARGVQGGGHGRRADGVQSVCVGAERCFLPLQNKRSVSIPAVSAGFLQIKIYLQI